MRRFEFRDGKGDADYDGFIRTLINHGPLPSLRTLMIHTGGLPQAGGESLGRAELPALERLEVRYVSVGE